MTKARFPKGNRALNNEATEPNFGHGGAAVPEPIRSRAIGASGATESEALAAARTASAGVYDWHSERLRVFVFQAPASVVPRSRTDRGFLFVSRCSPLYDARSVGPGVGPWSVRASTEVRLYGARASTYILHGLRSLLVQPSASASCSGSRTSRQVRISPVATSSSGRSERNRSTRWCSP